MPLLANNITLPEVGVSPGTPASGGLTVFAKTDGVLYTKNHFGGEYALVTSGSAQTITAPKTFAASAITDIPVQVKGFLGQTGDLTQWQNSTGTILAAVTNVGIFSSRAGWFAATATGDLTLYVSGFASQSAALSTFKSGASASGNLTEWQSSGAVVLAKVTPAGAIYGTGVYDNNSRVYSSGNLVPISGISATGTPNSTTFLRGDGSWQVISAGTASNVVTSSGVTANKLTVSSSIAPPSAPSLNDIWIVNDVSSITGNTGSVGEIDHVDFSNPVDLSALTTTYVDIDGYSIDVGPQAQPYMLSLFADIASNTGSAAAGSSVVYRFKVVDVTNGSTWIYVPVTVQQMISTTYQFQGVVNGSRRIAPHASARTYKVQVSVLNAIPANWGGAGLLAHDAPTQGVYPPAYIRAEYT